MKRTNAAEESGVRNHAYCLEDIGKAHIRQIEAPSKRAAPTGPNMMRITPLSVTSHRCLTWATTWAVIQIVSHLEESGIPQEASMAMEPVSGVKTWKTVQMAGSPWVKLTTVCSTLMFQFATPIALAQEEQKLKNATTGAAGKIAYGPTSTPLVIFT